METVQLRHYDYKLVIGTLAAGKSRTAVPLNLETDSSFILRGRMVHYRSSVAQLPGQMTNLANYWDRYTGPDLEYLSQSVTRFSYECPTMGQMGSPLPVRPPVIYPPGGVILVDVYNSGAVDLPGLTLIFRGQKIFQPGVLHGATYPERMQTIPYTYMSAALALGVSESRSNLIRNVLGDADFVVRSLSIGSCNPTAGQPSQYYQILITLRDSDGRAYSNLPVHVDAAYGACGSLPAGGSGADLPGNVAVGPWHPSLITPEIYVRRNDFLYYDLVRNDAFVGGLGNVDLQLAFNGAKVYPL